jgi:hypothetical protein
MIINLYIYDVPASDFSNGYFLAESPEFCINSNILELKNQPIEFYGNSRSDVINQVIAYARSKGLSGRIKLN